MSLHCITWKNEGGREGGREREGRGEGGRERGGEREGERKEGKEVGEGERICTTSSPSSFSSFSFFGFFGLSIRVITVNAAIHICEFYITRSCFSLVEQYCYVYGVLTYWCQEKSDGVFEDRVNELVVDVNKCPHYLRHC